MSKGTKNYFRHSIFMHKHPAMTGIISQGGMAAYGRTCILFELMAAQEIDNECQGTYTFHKKTLRESLALVERTLNLHLTLVQHWLNLHLTFTEHTVVIYYPKMMKYLGKYISSDPKESKEKEKKINKKKNGKFKFNIEELTKLYDETKTAFKSGHKILLDQIKSQQDVEDFKASIKNYNEFSKFKNGGEFRYGFNKFCEVWKGFIERPQELISEDEEDAIYKRMKAQDEEDLSKIEYINGKLNMKKYMEALL